MTTDQHERDTYEERLLSELRAYVAERPTSGTRVAVERRRRLPKVALAGAAAAAVVGGVVIATGGDGASPAYAVEQQGDGSVSVEIRKLEDADGLQAKLRAAGIPAVVKYLPVGKTCKAGWFTPAQSGVAMRGTVSGSSVAGGPESPTTFTVDPGTLGPDQTLVITTSTGALPPPEDGADGAPHGQMASIGMAVAQGPIGQCEVVDAPTDGPPPLPVGAGGSFRTHGEGPGTPPAGTQVERVEPQP